MRALIMLLMLACWMNAAVARPLFETLDGNLPVRLQSVQLRADIAVGMAQTTVRMEVYNPNPRQLEATLHLPLGPAQQVSGFALDIGGVLRPAVPVDKAKGQQVFEAIQRQRVDPALLEQVAGNNFRMRIYPVPPRGTRVVELTIIETLGQRHGQWHYRPPLTGVDPRAEVSIDLNVVSALPPQAGGGGRFDLEGGSYRLRRTAAANVAWEVRVPAGGAPLVMVQAFGGERYVLAQLPVPAAAPSVPPPRVMGLLWDSSGSGERRAHAAELATLGHYFAVLRNIEVRLVRFRDRAEEPLTFHIVDGNWSALRAELQRTVYDGASRLGGWKLEPDVDAWLLVSDGLHNYSQHTAVMSRLDVLSSVRGADIERLQALATQASGVLADLSSGLAPRAAAEVLLRGRIALPVLGFEGARDVLLDPAGVQDGALRVAARLDPAAREFVYVMDGLRQVLPLDDKAAPFAALTWARYKVQALSADQDGNAAAIRSIGKAFAIPTRATSLIVLETLDDYIRHDILPPADMRAAFFAARAQSARQQRDDEKARIDAVAAAFARKMEWWSRPYPQSLPPPIPVRIEYAAAAPVAAAPRAPVPESARVLEMAAEPPSGAPRPSVPPPHLEVGPAAGKPAHAIRLQPWAPDAPYMVRLRRTPDARLYAAYLDEKRSHPASTAFFVDVSDLLFKRGKKALAIRVLSNLAEMELGNRQVLRVLAYRLMQAGEPRQAVDVLRKVLELAPEEPQSHRDLGLAYAASGRPQAAVDSLYEVVKGNWDARFAEVQLIALAELNAIRARHPGVNTAKFDKRLLRNLPLDLRVVLGWDTDNLDIDLWVTDPNGQPCSYSQRTTYQGGRMSDDFTGGYGPEEFSLRRAKPGIYKVHAHFYGHNQQAVVGPPTLQVTLQTGFGTRNQRTRTITLRLDGQGRQAYVGEIEVK